MLPSRLHAQKIDRDTNQHPRFGLLLLGMFRADPWPGTDRPRPAAAVIYGRRRQRSVSGHAVGDRIPPPCSTSPHSQRWESLNPTCSVRLGTSLSFMRSVLHGRQRSFYD